MNAMTYTAKAADIYGDVLHECVACRAKKIGYWRKKSFHYTHSASHKAFHIYRCGNCGTAFLNRPPALQWLQTIYQYSGQALTQTVTLKEVLTKEIEFPNCTVDAERISQLASRLSRTSNGYALDVGSGFGFCTQALRRLGYRTLSINPGQYENKVFKKLNGYEPLAMTFEDYQTNGKFGVVVMSQVLEHLLEPDQAIKKVSGLLSPGGVFACAVPNYSSFLVKLLGTKDNACLWVPEHVNYFTESGLRALVERHDFHIVKVQQITRIPFNAVSKRLGLEGRTAVIVDGLVKNLQRPFAGLMNLLGLGIYINLYAVKQQSA
ncbi:MAG: class I SAM-dependent methyltransferase [Methylovulum sp.]|nr:class I SAM-dependent methyltransferase [Methylovulum sp.]